MPTDVFPPAVGPVTNQASRREGTVIMRTIQSWQTGQSSKPAYKAHFATKGTAIKCRQATARNTSEVLLPPKPKEFEMAERTFCSRA